MRADSRDIQDGAIDGTQEEQTEETTTLGQASRQAERLDGKAKTWSEQEAWAKQLLAVSSRQEFHTW